MTNPTTAGPIKPREITRKDWPLIRDLFGSRGACGGCWCMHWRRERGGQAWERVKGEPNRRAFKRLLESGRAHGVIAVADRRAVGWCSFGLRSDFPRLERTKAYRSTESGPDCVWSINCLFLDKEHRGRGLSKQMVRAAVKAIRKRKGKLIEAYPVTLTKDGRQLPPAFSFTGPEIIYRRLGFKEVRRLASTRPVYRLELT